MDWYRSPRVPDAHEVRETLAHHRAHLATAALAVVAALAIWTVSTRVFPYHSLNHDEGVYLQQAAMLLEGQLNLYPPVQGVFRPWFFIDAGDHFYPKYAPVPAAMFALGELAGGYRLALPAIAGGNVALVVGVGREAFDRRVGLVAGAVLLCSPLFLLNSAVFLPYAPTTLLNLAFACAYLRADRTGGLRWAAVAGAAVGLAFFSRPFTAVLFAAPFLCHALWTLRAEWRPLLDRRVTEPVRRQAVTAALGLAGVALTLGYNAVMTGSPWLFPYEAFAPHDGLGFGHREILNHEVEYTLDLAIRANRQVVELFFTEWVAGGLLGTALAGAGVVVAAVRRFDARQAAVAGVAPAVIAGNVYFWGNFNVLGDLDRAGDGLVNVLGPYYHFDLLVPTALFAGVAVVALWDFLTAVARPRLDRRVARVAVAFVLVIALIPAGVVAAGDVDERIEENMDATETYERVYEPFEGGPPANSVVLVPTPYGNWLNHPFQPLRNDPGFDGRAVYATNIRPFAVADAFPDRRLYRFVYRGAWAPHAGSPRAARLQRVRDVTGERVTLNATVGIPDGAGSVTARVGTDAESTYRVVSPDADRASFRLTITPETVRLHGDGRTAAGGEQSIPLEGDVELTVFVDYGPRGGFTYLFDVPIDEEGDRLRALTPVVERCRGANTCRGAAAFVPASAPEGVSVRTNLSVGNDTGTTEVEPRD